MQHVPQVQWVAPSPLWPTVTSADSVAMRRPVLLRFASDTFMEDFAAILENAPAKIADQVARGESFRERPLGTAVPWTSQPLETLKLYQPAHGHFTLVVASLVCRLPGLPDRAFDVPAGETAFFVLRRLGSGGEYAWSADGGTKPGWRFVAAGAEQAMQTGEERLPLFPMVFSQDGRRRRVLAGLVPTGSRETFQAGPELSPLVVDPADPRPDELQNRVTSMLDSLKDPMVRIGDAQAKEISLFVLLDFADYLIGYLPSVWQPVIQGTGTIGTSSPSHELYQRLLNTQASDGVRWLAAMRSVWAQRDAIARGEATNPVIAYDLRKSPMPRDLLVDEVRKSLGSWASPPAPTVDLPVPKLGSGNDVRYVLRMVFDRPHCAPLRPPVVSEPTEPFALASFFDSDAPARSIRISLPLDTSPAGLRAYRKNVGFVISDQLKQQMGCVKNATAALKGDIACGGSIDIGMICSFSIPIITIVALILLMIMVMLLNIIFWWLPFFRICLPAGIKAKA